MSVFDRVREKQAGHGTVRFYETEKGVTYTNHECQRRLKSAVCAVQRWFPRAIRTMTKWNDSDMNAYELREMRYVLSDLQEYVEAVQRELDRIEGTNRRAERVEALRQVAGRTPEEAAAYLAKADELERGGSDAA